MAHRTHVRTLTGEYLRLSRLWDRCITSPVYDPILANAIDTALKVVGRALQENGV